MQYYFFKLYSTILHNKVLLDDCNEIIEFLECHLFLFKNIWNYDMKRNKLMLNIGCNFSSFMGAYLQVIYV